MIGERAVALQQLVSICLLVVGAVALIAAIACSPPA